MLVLNSPNMLVLNSPAEVRKYRHCTMMIIEGNVGCLCSKQGVVNFTQTNTIIIIINTW